MTVKESVDECGSADRFHILIVEDELEIQLLYREALEERKDLFLEFQDNGTHVPLILTKKRFDSILMDINLPGINGLELINLARNGSLNRTTPIFLVSGNVNNKVFHFVERLQGVEIWPKPIDIVEMQKAIWQVLDQREKLTGYDFKLVNAFIDGAYHFFQSNFSADPIIGRYVLRKEIDYPEKRSAYITFDGDGFDGSVSIGIDDDQVKHLAQGLGDIDADENIICEMANQVVGNVKRNLLKMGYPIKIGLPRILENSEISQNLKQPVIEVSIGYEDYKIDVAFTMSTLSLSSKSDDEKDEELGTGEMLFF